MRTDSAPRKALGQHFLHQRNVVEQIIAAFRPARNDRVIEIGPGRGILTEALIDRVGRLDAVEIDGNLVRQLNDRFGAHPNFHLHHGDALKFDYCATAGSGRLRVIGNLPYNISTPLLFRLLDHGCVADMLLMLQKEVVDRLVAAAGGKDYGRLTVMAQQRCRVQRVLTVAPGAFTPPPKVDSAVVELIPYTESPYPVTDPARFRRIVQSAFSQRRKTLRNALKNVVGTESLINAGIDPGQRPEQLSVAAYARLANSSTGSSRSP